MHVRLAALALIALPLAACVSFGEKTPPSLMTLTAVQPLGPGPAKTIEPGRAVQVAIPIVPATLATLRVPVRASDTALAYLVGAQWAEPPARLFRTLLADTITQRTGRPVLDPRQTTIGAGIRVGGALRTFGLDAPGNAAVVAFDATLARGDAPVETRRFEARVPIAAVDTASAAPALNQAANQVAGEVADWIGG